MYENTSEPEREHTLRVECRFKNARLYGEIERRYSSLAKLHAKKHGAAPLLHTAAREMDVPYGTLGLLLNLKLKPYRFHPTYTWSHPALAISEALKIEPEELFPANLYGWTVAPKMLVIETTPTFVPLGAAAHLTLPPGQLESAETEELSDRISSALETLTPREQQVIRKRFGLGDGDEQTLDEIGRSLALSRERIRQLETRALRKLRDALPNTHTTGVCINDDQNESQAQAREASST